MRLGLLAAAVVLIAAAVLVVMRRRAISPTAMSSDDVQQGIRELADLAVEDARSRHGTTLDYSLASVESVERILSAYHDQAAATGAEVQRQQQLGIRYGAYVGEAIRRARGGHWERDHPVAGPGSFPLATSRGQSFPIGWCVRRLKNGPGDNVWHKVQILFIQDVPVSAMTEQP